VLPRPVLIKVQGSDKTSFVADTDLECAFHNEEGVFFTRIRFGRRASSS
jgi:hypothetical protein